MACVVGAVAGLDWRAGLGHFRTLTSALGLAAPRLVYLAGRFLVHWTFAFANAGSEAYAAGFAQCVVRGGWTEWTVGRVQGHRSS